jgi:diguanylate cyclase (GGDEF)-like protein
VAGRLLVIDDDLDTGEMLVRLLRVSGHEVEYRLDGRGGLAAFAESRHDVVLTDLRLPDMDGIEVLRSLRSIDPDCGVIVISAISEDRAEAVVEALRGGAADYLTKPLADLSELERAVAAAVERRTAEREDAKRLHDLELRARTDPLTGLANRLELEQRLGEEVSRLGRSLEGLTVALFDIDQFKSVNDSHGHQAGDRVLTAVAEAIRENCRAYDVKARYGGDEFVVVMPETRLEQGIAVAEKIRRAASGRRLAIRDGELRVTLSAGVTSTSPFERLTPDELVRRADLALYEAKRAGRDRTLAWSQGPPPSEILVVEGDEAEARRIVHLCASLGYRADWASSGAEAIERAAHARYALVLVSLDLPDIDGAALIARLREHAPALPAALVVDAAAEHGRVQEALARTPAPLARKPVSIEHLRALITRARVRG